MEVKFNFSKESVIGVVGSGAMGSGIAQVAATAGNKVFVYDTNEQALQKADANLIATLSKLVEKQKISQEERDAIFSKIEFINSQDKFATCDLIIEAIVENLEVKKSVFSSLEIHLLCL